MPDAPSSPMSWPVIIAIMLATGVVVGMTLGLFGERLGLDGGTVTTGVGAAIGVVGAMLIARRAAQLRAS